MRIGGRDRNDGSSDNLNHDAAVIAGTPIVDLIERRWRARCCESPARRIHDPVAAWPWPATCLDSTSEHFPCPWEGDRVGVGMLSTGILRTNLLKSETVHTVENGVGTRRKNLRPLTEVIVHIEIASGQDPVRRGVVGTDEHRQV